MTTENHDEPVPAPALRLALGKAAPDFYKAMLALEAAASEGLDPTIKELVKIRASQINGCAFCIDMHLHDARKLGIGEQKLTLIAVWRETSLFTARERAALALAEAVTRLGEHGVPDEVWDEAARRFSAAELPRVFAMAVTINAWNRIAITTRMPPPPRP